MNIIKILSIIKDKDTKNKLQDTLLAKEYEITFVEHCKTAREELENQNYDVILMDDELYSEQSCKDIKILTTVPILLLISYQSSIDTVIKAMDIGVNDYLVLPFSKEDLLKRIHILINKLKRENILCSEDIVINIDKHDVKYKNETINLTPLEFKLLTIFMRNPNEALSRTFIFDQMYKDEEINERKIDSHIKNLRTKLKDRDKHYIKSVSKIGYKFIQKQ